ncbi:hypothetical protein FNV43_RR19409 [Rhamnella rubrinervis]|uniref:Uncharacterized protein n=1 Tax=Rhamnella rubrinervis TaxID=2594499 RepID=A0A8K0GPG8_9ROSA|nr:hypothetical protein FNV43_RR19409 [Rhamnella rubrinervis]
MSKTGLSANKGGNALQSEVLRLREEIFLVDAGLGTPRICMQDEPTGVPINQATRFENKVGSMNVVACVSLIKERVAARFNDLMGSTDVVASEPLLQKKPSLDGTERDLA